MSPATLSPEERQEIFSRYLEKYLKRGFKIISRSPTTAELCKPARFPHWLLREQTRFLDIDEQGKIFIRSV